MTKDEALKILKHHNLWRRNQDDVNPYEMGNPTELGKAIDYVVEALEQPAQDYVLICKRCGDDLGIVMDDMWVKANIMSTIKEET